MTPCRHAGLEPGRIGLRERQEGRKARCCFCSRYYYPVGYTDYPIRPCGRARSSPTTTASRRLGDAADNDGEGVWLRALGRNASERIS